jgi:ribonucleoside-diphosphate reductase beta chain
MDDLAIFPIKNQDLWDMYKKAESCFWVAEEINLYEDLNDWKKMTQPEQYFISMILAFFAQADGIVNLNVETLLNLVPYKEAKFFYGFQIAMENIHNETYSLLIDTYIEQNKKAHYLNAAQNFEFVNNKQEWALRYADVNQSLESKLIAFIIVEGLFFSGAFCSIFWLKERGLMKGLTFSNELISRDEGLHVDFSIMVYKKMLKEGKIKKLSDTYIYDMFADAIEVEREFINESLNCSLIGMNKDLMYIYILYVSDYLLKKLDLEPIYNVECPFHFMQNISMIGKTNFFERKNSDYMISNDTSSKFDFDIDIDY